MPVTSHELYPAVAFGADGVEHIRGTSRRGYSEDHRAVALIPGRHRLADRVADDADAAIGIQADSACRRCATIRDRRSADPIALSAVGHGKRWREQTRNPASAAVLEEADRLVKPQEKTVFDVVKGGAASSPARRADQSVRAQSADGARRITRTAGCRRSKCCGPQRSVSADAMGAGAEIGAIEAGKLADIAIVTQPAREHRESAQG